MDPYLEYDDIRLQAIRTKSNKGSIAYGSQDDDVAAKKSLSVVEPNDHHLKEAVITHLMNKFDKLSEVIFYNEISWVEA